MGKWPSLNKSLTVVLFTLLTLTWFQVTQAQAVPQSKPKPRVIVHNQAIVDSQITVAEVVAPQAGWIVIHRSQAGNLDAVIGLTPVRAGRNTNVIVKLDLTQATETLYTLLHSDAGRRGIYEFPGPDAPIIVSNPPMITFQITGLPPKAGAPADSAVAQPESTEKSTAAEPVLHTNEPVWLTNNATEAQLTGQGEPGGILQVLVDDTIVNTTTIGATGAWTVTFPLDRQTMHTIAVQPIGATAAVSSMQTQITGQPFGLYLPFIAHSLRLQGSVTQSANLRAGPGLTFPIVGRARAGQGIVLAACDATCDWYQLATGTWIAAFLVQGVTPSSALLPRVTSP